MKYSTILASFLSIGAGTSSAPFLERTDRTTGDNRPAFQTLRGAERAIDLPGDQPNLPGKLDALRGSALVNVGVSMDSRGPGSEYHHLQWGDLPQEIQDAYRVLGWDQEKWDTCENVPETGSKPWAVLTDEQREAAGVIGYTQATWHHHQDWTDLPVNIQDAYRVLGWDQDKWDTCENVPDSEMKEWDELTDVQEEAAEIIGYTQTIWDEEHGDSFTYSPTGLGPTYSPAGPAPTYSPAGPAPTYSPAGPAPTYSPAGPAPTYSPAGPAPTYSPSGLATEDQLMEE